MIKSAGENGETVAKIKSSNIDEITHLEGDKLEVKFKDGGTYHYYDVPKHKHDKLINADSIGEHFHQHIKNKHKWDKIK
jgi:KTSC domain-containing protein